MRAASEFTSRRSCCGDAFELLEECKNAKALGPTVPPAQPARADAVIERHRVFLRRH